VSAISAADSTKSAQATVTVTPAVSITLSPNSASVVASQTQQFTATVSGTTNTAATWSVNGIAGGNSTAGTVSTSGLYTAPLAVPTGGSATVSAISAADSTKIASAAVTVQPLVSVGLSPTLATVQVSQTQQFTATVSGTTNTAVTWGVNGIAGGNSTVGTVSTNGLYTAPSVVPSGGSVTVTATSAADTTKSAGATVTVIAPTLTITTSSLSNGETGVAYSATLAATGGASPYTWSATSGTLPAGVTLGTAGALSGTPTTSGAYTFGIQVVDSIGVTASQSYNLTISPTTHSVSLNWTASASSNLIGYKVYRATQSGGPYAQYTSSPIIDTTYTDSAVQTGQTYFYVVTAVDNNNNESPYSNEAQAVVPSP
jgi:hypothetical protein